MASPGAQRAPQIVRMSELPLTKLLFLPDGTLVGAGHSYDPILFARTANGWAAGKLEGQGSEARALGRCIPSRVALPSFPDIGYWERVCMLGRATSCT